MTIGREEVLLDGEGLPEVLFGLVVPPDAGVHLAQRVEWIRLIGREIPVPLQEILGLREVTALGPVVTEHVVGGRVVRVDGEEALVFRDGVLVPIHHRQVVRTQPVALRVVREALDVLVEELSEDGHVAPAPALLVDPEHELLALGDLVAIARR